jgi:hypothetical protein
MGRLSFLGRISRFTYTISPLASTQVAATADSAKQLSGHFASAQGFLFRNSVDDSFYTIMYKTYQQRVLHLSHFARRFSFPFLSWLLLVLFESRACKPWQTNHVL